MRNPLGPCLFVIFSWSPTWSTHATCPSTPLRTSLACMTMLTSPRTRKKPSCSSTIFCSLRSVNCDFPVRSCVFLAILKPEEYGGCSSNIPVCLLKPFAWPAVVCWDFLVRSCVFLTLTLKQEEYGDCPSNIPMCLLKPFAWPVVVCWDFLVRSCVFLTLTLKQEEYGDCPSNIPMCLLKPFAWLLWSVGTSLSEVVFF